MRATWAGGGIEAPFGRFSSKVVVKLCRAVANGVCATAAEDIRTAASMEGSSERRVTGTPRYGRARTRPSLHREQNLDRRNDSRRGHSIERAGLSNRNHAAHGFVALAWISAGRHGRGRCLVGRPVLTPIEQSMDKLCKRSLDSGSAPRLLQPAARLWKKVHV